MVRRPAQGRPGRVRRERSTIRSVRSFGNASVRCAAVVKRSEGRLPRGGLPCVRARCRPKDTILVAKPCLSGDNGREALRPQPSFENHRLFDAGNKGCWYHGNDTRAHLRRIRGTRYGIRSPAQPHRVLSARRPHAHLRHGQARCRPRHAGGRGHRPRRDVRRAAAVRDVRQGGGRDGQARQAHLRLRGVLHHRRGVAQGRQAQALPPAFVGQDERGVPQPGEARQRVACRQLLLQAAHHVLHAAEVRQGHHRLVGVHRGHHSETARQPPVRRGGGVGQQVRQLLRSGGLLHRAAEPGCPHGCGIHADRAQPHAHRRGESRRPQDHRHERFPLSHERGREGPGLPAVHQLGRGRERHEPAAFRERPVLHEDRGGDARSPQGLSRGVRHHGGGGREVRRRARARLHPAAVPSARGRDGGELVSQARAGGSRQVLWRPGASGGPGACRLRDGHHHPAGLPGVLPHRAGVHRVGAQPGHRRRSGPRLGRRRHRGLRHGHHRSRPAFERAAVRALPVSRTRGDARYRRRLRAGPPRRGDQPHQGRVRRGPRVPGHHVRHPPGEKRRARRRARAGLPVLDRRPHLQDDRRRAGHHHREGA